jgi:predicted unusual protein kinase regulating ubiquinone biosynthesis (AarF/ABC1/UbiB family)
MKPIEGSKPIRVRQSVAVAVDNWRQRRQQFSDSGSTVMENVPLESILQSIPRREQLDNHNERQLWLPYLEPVVFKPNFLRSLGRLFTWFNVLFSIMLGNFFDQLLRRDSLERRAIRLRQALERAGGTFVKLGQQVAMRIDLVPWAYCVELSKMLDRMLPFPVEDALRAIERTIHRPWQEVFEFFDPKPIGSASMACVYQATLKDGTKVVVKIRRPGIAELFRADLQVLDWITGLAEFLTLVRPGFTRNLRAELREILMEELDFRREGRFQDIFRRNVSKSGKDFFTAPRVYFEYSGDEVLVQEFVSGLWLWEVIALVEEKTPQGLALLRKLNIDPAVVARRILWAAFWSMDEHVFFHADPHPANILIRPNNEVTFIDFGSCGSFNNQQRIALEQMVLSMKNQDVEAMTRASLSLMEPLPPVDLPALVKHSQDEYMRVLHTFNTPAKYTQYWERTSARQWFVLIGVAQKFNLPINLHMLRMIRATLLYDSIVLRLDNQLDRYQEYTEFMKDRAELVKLRWRKKLKDNAGDNFFLNLEELGKTFNDLMIRTQTTLSRPLVNLGSTVDKWIFATSVLSRMAGRILLVTLIGMGVVNIFQYFNGGAISFADVLSTVLQNRLYQLFLGVTLIFNVRHILFRLRDRDAAKSG